MNITPYLCARANTQRFVSQLPRALQRLRPEAKYLLERPDKGGVQQVHKLMSDTPRVAVFLLTQEELVKCTTVLELAKTMHKRWHSLSLSEVQKIKDCTNESWHQVTPKKTRCTNGGWVSFFMDRRKTKGDTKAEAAAIWKRLTPQAKEKYNASHNLKKTVACSFVRKAFRHRVGAPRRHRRSQISAWNFFSRRNGAFFVSDIKARAERYNMMSEEQKSRLAVICHDMKKIHQPVTPTGKPSGIVGFMSFTSKNKCNGAGCRRRIRAIAKEAKLVRGKKVKTLSPREVEKIALESFIRSVLNVGGQGAKKRDDPELRRQLTAVWKNKESYRTAWKSLTRATLLTTPNIGTSKTSSDDSSTKKSAAAVSEQRSMRMTTRLSVLATQWKVAMSPAERDVWKNKGLKKYQDREWGRARRFRRRHMPQVQHLRADLQKKTLDKMMKASDQAALTTHEISTQRENQRNKSNTNHKNTTAAARHTEQVLKKCNLPSWQWSQSLLPAELKARHDILLSKNESRDHFNARYRTSESVAAKVRATLEAGKNKTTKQQQQQIQTTAAAATSSPATAARLSRNSTTKTLQLNAIKRHLMKSTRPQNQSTRSSSLPRITNIPGRSALSLYPTAGARSVSAASSK